MRAAVVVLMALAAPAFGALFDTWKVHNGKTYSSPEEESLRKAIFDANVEKVNTHNMLGLPWTMGLNEFADLTSQEFAIGRIGGFRPRSLRRPRTVDNTPSVGAPSEVDWTTKGAVTAVKNQGQCGSCWAFSTTGSTEGAHFLAGNKLISLSEQQLVDCSGAEGNQGCNGGLMDDAFQYIINNGGIGSEASYPYTAQDGSCKKVASVATLSSYTDVGQNSESALMNAVAKTPVSVAVEADQSAWQLYSGGIVQASNCGTQLDHGVLVVGYKSGSYWKVKNSWGASWGESGYIRLQMNGDGSGTCGVQMEPSYPVV